MIGIDKAAIVPILCARPKRPSELAVLAGGLARIMPKPLRPAPHAARVSRPTSSGQTNLQATMDWLRRAQDVGEDCGVAWAYNFRGGWWPSYPETTGYIVPTFFDYAEFSGQADYRDRAVEMGEWLLSIQMPEGAFQGGRIDEAPRASVFNTGQILLGLVRLVRETGDDRYRQSAIRAADWLISVQDSDGA